MSAKKVNSNPNPNIDIDKTCADMTEKEASRSPLMKTEQTMSNMQ
jgi:hypothetical protein